MAFNARKNFRIKSKESVFVGAMSNKTIKNRVNLVVKWKTNKKFACISLITGVALIMAILIRVHGISILRHDISHQ